MKVWHALFKWVRVTFIHTNRELAIDCPKLSWTCQDWGALLYFASTEQNSFPSEKILIPFNFCFSYYWRVSWKGSLKLNILEEFWEFYKTIYFDNPSRFSIFFLHKQTDIRTLYCRPFYFSNAVKIVNIK